MMRYPNCIGGFLWALKDEAQWRDDLGRYDACGNLAPDGLVGPNGEEGGSCATVRAIFGGERETPPSVMSSAPRSVKRRDFSFPVPRLVAWKYDGGPKGGGFIPVDASFDWTATTNADSCISFSWTIFCTNKVDVLGVDFPVVGVAAKKWFGRGPDRIWRNRMRGPKWGVWEDVFNDAVPGVSWERPFKGWFDAKWMQIAFDDGLSLVVEPADGLFVGVGTPKDGPDNYLYTMPCELGVGVYHVIPAIGNKVFQAARGGPQGKPVSLPGATVQGGVVFTP